MLVMVFLAFTWPSLAEQELTAHRSDSWKGCTCLAYIKRTEYQREVYVNLSRRGVSPVDSRRITPMGVVGVLAQALSQKHDSIPTFSCDSHWWSKTEICKNSSSENEFPMPENLLVKLDCLNGHPANHINLANPPGQARVVHSEMGPVTCWLWRQIKSNQRYETALEELFNDIFNRSVLVCEEKRKDRSVLSFYRSSDFRCWNQYQEREMWPSVKFSLILYRIGSLQQFTSTSVFFTKGSFTAVESRFNTLRTSSLLLPPMLRPTMNAYGPITLPYVTIVFQSHWFCRSPHQPVHC